jgi:hypothetical protein
MGDVLHAYDMTCLQHTLHSLSELFGMLRAVLSGAPFAARHDQNGWQLDHPWQSEFCGVKIPVACTWMLGSGRGLGSNGSNCAGSMLMLMLATIAGDPRLLEECAEAVRRPRVG